MSPDETISVALAPDLVATVHEAVASGDYPSASEIVSEALRSWSTDRAMASTETAQLRRLWEAGLQSGRGSFASIEDIKREARRLQGARTQSGMSPYQVRLKPFDGNIAGTLVQR